MVYSAARQFTVLLSRRPRSRATLVVYTMDLTRFGDVNDCEYA